MMRHAIILLTCLLAGRFSGAQQIINRDAEIYQMVSEISADSLKQYISSLVAFETRSTLSSQTDPERGIGAARNYVLRKFQEFGRQAQGRFSSFIDTTTLQPDGRRVNRRVILGNVMGILKGTDPADDRVLIISGHLDSRNTDVMDSVNAAPGANDDASGVAALMECARIMTKHRFPSTVIFVAVSGEEQGLLGSAFLAEKAKREKWNLVAMLNNDIVGSNNSSETGIINNTQLRVFSEGIPHAHDAQEIQKIISLGLENDGASRQLARYVKEVGERYVDHFDVTLQYRTDRFLRGGDHLPFLKNGFTAVRLTEMNENFDRQHQNVRSEGGKIFGDLEKFIDYEYLRKVTGVNLATLANLAKSPAPPVNVKIEVRQLTNKTSLSWDEPVHSKPAGYYVLMRPTASSVWTRKIFTTKANITLPYSKDNYFFAIQSVSADGNESLPMIPRP